MSSIETVSSIAGSTHGIRNDSSSHDKILNPSAATSNDNASKPSPYRGGLREGAASMIRGVTYTVFDNAVGPQLRLSYPPNDDGAVIRPAAFEAAAEYVIVDKHLCGKIISVRSEDMLFVNYSAAIDNPKYQRNTLLFALGIVLPPDADARPFERVLRKAGELLITLELESEYLYIVNSQASSHSARASAGAAKKASSIAPPTGSSNNSGSSSSNNSSSSNVGSGSAATNSLLPLADLLRGIYEGLVASAAASTPCVETSETSVDNTTTTTRGSGSNGAFSSSSSVVCVSVDAANSLVASPLCTSPVYECNAVNESSAVDDGSGMDFDWGGIYSNGWGAPPPPALADSRSSASASSSGVGSGGTAGTTMLRDSDVPIPITQDLDVFTAAMAVAATASKWDISVLRAARVMDGTSCIRRIAAKADMDIECVKRCIRVLLLYRCILVVPMFMFSDRYALRLPVDRVAALANSRMLREVHLFSCTGSVASSDGRINSPERQSRLSNSVTSTTIITAGENTEAVPGSDLDARSLVRFILACHPGISLASVLVQHKDAVVRRYDIRRLMAALEHVGILRRVLAFPVDRDSLLSPRPPCSERTITYSGHYGASGGAMTSSKCTGVESALAAAFRLEVPPADVLASVVAAGGVVVYK